MSTNNLSENCPNWLMVMNYFGLDHSFIWTDDQINYYSSLYKSEMDIDEMVNNKVSMFHIETLINKIDSLNSSASNEGCSGDITVVNQEMLDELVQLADCIKQLHQQVVQKKQAAPNTESNMTVSIDGGVTFQQVMNEVRIVYQNVPIPGEDETGELHLNATAEGLIMDLWSSLEEPLDQHMGTSAEMIDDIIERLVGDTVDRSADDGFVCVHCLAKGDIEDSCSTIVGLVCHSCNNGEVLTGSINQWQHEVGEGNTKLGFSEWMVHARESACAG